MEGIIDSLFYNRFIELPGSKLNILSHCVKSHHMEDIIDSLFYNRFIELPGSKLNILGKANTFNFPGHVKQGEKNILRNEYPART